MKAHMRIVMGIFLGLLLIAPLGTQGQAQTVKTPGDQKATTSTDKKDYEAFDLGELYVKGERIQGVQQMTQVSEFTAEQIEKTNSKTVAEALAFVPGVIVTTGARNEPSVRIHGLSQDRTLVLIDGVPYYETYRGSLDLNSIPVDNVARIEVQKGVSSVLYGPNNLAGIINIITKKPTSRPSLNALAEIGDYESRRFALSHGRKVGKLSYWLGYDHLEADGWYLSRSFDRRVTAINRSGGLGGNLNTIIENGGVRENSDYKMDSFWGKVGVEPTDNSEYYMNFHYITREKGAPASLISNNVRPTFSQLWRWPEYNNWGIDLSGQQKLGDRVTLKGKFFYHDHMDEMDSFSNPDYTGLYATSRYKDNMLGGSLLSDIKLAEIDTLRLAYNYRRDQHKERAFESDPYDKAISYTGSIALENEFTPIKNLSIVAGLGYDWFNVTKAFEGEDSIPYKDKYSPMAGVTYLFSDGTKVFGSWAQKIRFPTLSQLFGSRGNPDLKPEESQNYVLGVSRGITQFARAEASVFHYDIRDYITRETPDPLSRYLNYGKVRIYGFEVGGEIFPAKDLSFRINYTYTDARDRSDNRVTSRMLRIPEHKVDLGVSYLVPVVDVKLDLTGLYASKMWGQLPAPTSTSTPAIRTGSYFILDARVGKAIFKDFEIYFVAKNIFDRDYESELGYPGQGRNLYTGIKYSF